jgi:hypothetical protein
LDEVLAIRSLDNNVFLRGLTATYMGVEIEDAAIHALGYLAVMITSHTEAAKVLDYLESQMKG